MSEFYFEYKCLALAGEDMKKGEKALDFFLYQDYINGSMQVQVYIPPALQKRHHGAYTGVRLYHMEHGVGFPTLKSLRNNFEYFPMQGLDKPINKENGFFIQPKSNDLSGTGIIAFMREGNKEPLEEDCYKYAINYSRREVISYSITEYKRKIVIEIRYPRLITDVFLHVVYKNGSKPLFIQDRKNENNLVKKKNGEVREIKLKKLGREFETIVETVDFEKTDEFDFRLAFADEELNKLYTLVDESDYGIEDKKRRKESISSKKRSYRSERVIKCPYCNKPLSKEVIDFSTGVISCSGKILNRAKPKFSKEKKVIVCDGETKLKDTILPVNVDKLPTMNIAVAGYPSCGKTVYLASLINMSVTNVDDKSVIYKSNPFVLTKITEKMADHDKSVTYVEMNTLDSNFNLNNTQEINRGLLVNGVNIKGRYSINVGQSIEKQTLGQAAEILSYNPIGFQLGDLGFTYFYDVPGEAFKEEYKQKLRTFDVADGIIAIINGDSISKHDGVSNVSNNQPLVELDASLKAIKRLAREAVDLENMPIAIVFTKLDLKISNYLDTDSQEILNSCFDENCHNLREDIISLLPKNKKYKGSVLERHIDCASYEIDHYLRSLQTEEAGAFNDILDHYKNIKFFACSALGGNGVFETAGEKALVKYRPRRLRVELPIVWLLHKKGLIR